MAYKRSIHNSTYIDEFDAIVSCSCGSILAPFIICKMDLIQFKKEIIEITNTIMNTENKEQCLYTICNCLHIIKDYLLKSLPENAHILCSNKLHIQTIYLPHCKSHCFHDFSSKEDLVDKIIKSCHIPIITGSITNDGYIDRVCDCCCYCESVKDSNISKIGIDSIFDLKNIFVIPDEKYIERNFANGMLL